MSSSSYRKPVLIGLASALIGSALYSGYKKYKNKRASLLDQAVQLFYETFGDKKGLVAACAPGRVNLIGEHTDYNDGFVFPLAIDRYTYIVGKYNGGSKYRILSANINDEKGKGRKKQVLEFDEKSLIAKGEKQNWHNYFRGVVSQYIFNDYPVKPFDCVIIGNVPLGGGLSSSASLEVATATFIDALLKIATPPTRKALLCQTAEHDYANMPCGIMDQFISVFGQRDHALLLDCRSMSHRSIKISDPNISILITNSNVVHELSGSEYKDRREECEKAVAALRKIRKDIKALRDAEVSDLEGIKSVISPVTYQRAYHVIKENQRTLQASTALERGEYQTLGRLMKESHSSLQLDYEVSCKELDILVDIANNCKGVYGSRMTGGGFGGCTVTLVETAKADEVIDIIQKEYLSRSGKQATCMITRPCQGAVQITI